VPSLFNPLRASFGQHDIITRLVGNPIDVMISVYRFYRCPSLLFCFVCVCVSRRHDTYVRRVCFVVDKEEKKRKWNCPRFLWYYTYFYLPFFSISFFCCFVCVCCCYMYVVHVYIKLRKKDFFWNKDPQSHKKSKEGERERRGEYNTLIPCQRVNLRSWQCT